MSMKMKQLQRVMELAKYLDDLYQKIGDLSEKEFIVEAQKSPWPNCLYKMREGMNIPEVLNSINSPAELLIALKNFDKIKEDLSKGV